MIIHHSMLIEHGNLIADGNLAQRNLRTRNLKQTGFISNIILYYTHDDPFEHTLHHTSPQLNNRPFPHKYLMPDCSTYITISEHLGILKDMLTGVEANDKKFHNSI